MNDAMYMSKAIELARKGCGYTNPNPMVGAVIVKNDKIIGSGYHEMYGKLHAERNALASCSESAVGATMYVTLEPCCHYGKTPPCTEAIIENRLAKVVIGSRDPNPKVSGKGARILEDNGITIVRDFMRKECDEINPVFFHYITNKTPFVVMKYAMTMDGKIATYTNESKWITGEAARENVHKDRHRYAGIMVGVGTVLTDDPLLTCRLEGGINPVRIICDTNLQTPLTSNVVKTTDEAATIIATASTDRGKIEKYIDKKCKIITVSKDSNGHIDLKQLMTKLGAESIDSILLEGGSTLNWSALEAKVVNKVQAYIAPKIFGSQNAKSPVGGMGVSLPSQGIILENSRIYHFGNDIMIESEVKPCSQE